jgi:dolichyl-phosphate beta-glucosyltransferase
MTSGAKNYPTNKHQVALVVPCFNEAKRLDLGEFSQQTNNLNSELKILFVDDGSQDNSAELINNFCQENNHCKFLRLQRNSGKAEAVRLGILEAQIQFPDAEWIGFWDADLATSLGEAQHMLEFMKMFYEKQKVSAIWGSRISRLGSNIQRSMLRHYLSRMFVTLSSNVLKIKAYDSQCGAKLFSREVVASIFEKSFLSKWFFDLEILKRMKQNEVIEYPLLEWREIRGSKLKPLDSLRMYWDLFKIWKEYR